jgi:hypothetical protein
MPDGREVLETLFVQLVDPPRIIQLPGLPENVVPLAKTKHRITCKLPNDKPISIIRQQVDVLLNFAMTVHASQGRTRKNNVCDISNCKNHLGYYTALSRSSSADGTIILQGFNSQKIQGGIKGSLRQEFRELEILNEITRLRYLGELPKEIFGSIRSVLINKYYKTKSLNEVPEGVSKYIAWDEDSPLDLPVVDLNIKWKLLQKGKDNTDNNNNTLIKAEIIKDSSKDVLSKTKNQRDSVNKVDIKVNEQSKGVQNTKKSDKTSTHIKTQSTDTALSITKCDKLQVSNKDIENEITHAKSLVQQIFQNTTNVKVTTCNPESNKKRKDINNNEARNIITKQIRVDFISKPLQLKWSNNSCAYDVIILALYQLWLESPSLWTKQFVSQFKDLYFLSTKFQKVNNSELTLERVRYLWRYRLHKKNPNTYTMHGYTDMLQLLPEILQLNSNLITKVSTCVDCLKEVENYQGTTSWYGHYNSIWSSYLKFVHHRKATASIQGYINYSTKVPLTRIKCCTNNYFSTQTSFKQEPTILGFMLPDFSHMNNTLLQTFKFNKSISIYYDDSKLVKLSLKCIIYFGSSHFTARLVDRNSNVWYYDSTQDNGNSTKEKRFKDFTTDQLAQCYMRNASCVIYAKDF